jgi:hypothetical protein
MFINEIEGKKLKKPLEVKVSINYIAEAEDYEFYGDGETEEEAVYDLKKAIEGMYRFLKAEAPEDVKWGYSEEAKKQRNKILDLFE